MLKLFVYNHGLGCYILYYYVYELVDWFICVGLLDAADGILSDECMKAGVSCGADMGLELKACPDVFIFDGMYGA